VLVNVVMVDRSKAGHRQRLRERFLAGEVESRSDEMLLELLLTFAIGRKDVRPLAQELIRVFGSLSRVLSASPDELYKVKGVGPSSIALLKAVDFIQSASATSETKVSLPRGVDDTQRKLFENLPDGSGSERTLPNSRNKKSDEQETSSVPAKPIVKETKITTATSVADTAPEPLHPPRPSKKTRAAQKSIRRKFQVSNGYLLEFDQLARVMHFLLEHKDAKKINRKVLQEDTGLADRQVESLVSMGAAMGLIQPGRQILTPIGLVIAEHDIFIEKKGSLEWCHYAGAGSYRNLIWFEIFNRLLAEASPMTQEEWNKQLRNDLAGQYSKRTISKSLYEEVRFVIDAYRERNFSKLELLHQSSDGRLYRRRDTRFAPLVLCAMIYDFCATRETHLFQVGEMATMLGSPAVVFGLDAASFRQQVEGLHDRGWLRYETTHNLDQIRLKPGVSAIEFLTAHFEEREPRPNDEFGMMNDEFGKPSQGNLFE